MTSDMLMDNASLKLASIMFKQQVQDHYNKFIYHQTACKHSR